MNRLIISKDTDPFLNLGLEEYLFDTHEGGVTFYLWQNAHTVVIGKNQNAYAECDPGLLEREGISLARRKTGGGAVYHHLGNLNFTFIARDGLYDVGRQLTVILNAVKKLGVDAEFSGRNDILANGRKFSGNAFRSSGGVNLHHGTLLIDEDTGRMAKYLTVSPQKLQSKGVKSVRSRVINLREINPEISVESLIEALRGSFSDEYGAYTVCGMDKSEYEKYALLYASSEWRLGKNPEFDTSVSFTLDAGSFTVMLNIKGQLITDVKVFSDALDTTLPKTMETALKNSIYTYEGIRESLTKNAVHCAEVMASFISGKNQAP